MGTRLLGMAVIGTAAALSAQAVCADTAQYPERPIRFIVPYAPGGTSDFVARLVADGLTHELGQQVVADNRPGAASTLGMQLAAEATPDGYTIAINNIGLAVNETLRPHRSYRVLDDLAPISLVGFTPSVLAVNKNAAVRSVADLIKLAKAEPGKIPYGSAGAGSSTHLSMTLFESLAHVKLLHVPYKGGGPAINAMIAGEVKAVLVPIPTAYPHIQSGNARPLGVTGAKRSASLPDVPTIAESGVAGYEFTTWYGLVAPSHTPAAIVQRLNAAVAKTLALADTRARLQRTGLDPQASTPAEFGNLIRSEIAKWRKVIEVAAIPEQ